MNSISKEDLKLVLENHDLWLNSRCGKRADLSNTDLRDVNLRGAHLRGAVLCNADLSNTDLRGADLSNADLSNTDLRGADLSNADLSNSNLSRVALSNAKLRNTDLRNANLRVADLNGAVLSGANVIKVKNFYSIDNVGTFNGRITFSAEHDIVWAGCWSGSLEDFKIECKEIYSKYQEHKEDLIMCIEFFERKGGV